MQPVDTTPISHNRQSIYYLEPSPYDVRADAALQQALVCHRHQDGPNAIYWLATALMHDNRLQYDPYAHQLACRLTGLPSEQAIALLSQPAHHVTLMRQLSQPPPASFILPVRFVTSVLLAVIIVGYAIFDQAMPFTTETDPTLGVPPITVEYFEDEPLYVVPPPDAQDTSIAVVAVAHHNITPDYLLNQLSPSIHETGALFIVADLRALETAHAIDTLHDMLRTVQARTTVLFATGQDAAFLSRYVASDPQTADLLITSGATFLEPPPPDVELIALYGSQDALLVGSNNSETVQFADMAAWSGPLNYVVIDNAGHELDRRHIDVIVQYLQEL